MRNTISRLTTLTGLTRAESVNAGWLVFGTLFRLTLAAAVDIAVARYLEPEGFGQLRFALAVMLLFGTLSGFGLGGLTVRELVQNPERREEILGTVIGLRFLIATLAVPFATFTAYALRPGDQDVIIMTAILSTMATVAVLDSIDFLLQAELKSTYTVLVRTTSLVASSLAKLLLIFLDAPLWTFAIAYSVEFLVSGAAFLAAYVKLGYSPLRLRFSAIQARYMLLLIWPLFIGGVAGTINVRADQVMLGAMKDAEEVGFYAAASRLSIIWLFIPDAIALSAFPALVRAKEAGGHEYHARLKLLYAVLCWMGMAVALVITLTAGITVNLLYGSDFGATRDLLIVQIWASPFVFMGTLFNRWLTVEGRFGLTTFRHSLGAAVNVGLNLLLIPHYGAMGASIAGLISYATSSYFASFIPVSTREAGAMMTRALLRGPLDIYAALRHGPPRL
jgi:PST family polysaccharide transporter